MKHVYVDMADTDSHTHIPCAVGDYATLCGMDGEDPETGQIGHIKTDQPIDCPHCIAIWSMCKRIKQKEIKP